MKHSKWTHWENTQNAEECVGDIKNAKENAKYLQTIVTSVSHAFNTSEPNAYL